MLSRIPLHITTKEKNKKENTLALFFKYSNDVLYTSKYTAMVSCDLFTTLERIYRFL